jgi:hypothetical protein
VKASNSRAVLATWAGVALLAVGCSGGGGGDSEEQLGDVSPDALAIMVLPPEELGDVTNGLEIDGNLSGTSTASDAAENSVDPEDTPARIERTGRKSGYDLHFVDPDLSALRMHQGYVEVATGVELFDSPEQALAYRSRVLDDYERFVGTEISPGIRLSSADGEDLDVGSAGHLARSTIRGDGFAVHSTAIDFNVGRVVGTVLVSRADEEETEDTAVDFARALEQRIRSVAANELHDSPVQFEGGRSARQARPPKGGEGLAKLVLSVSDLPRGTFVDEEEYATGGGSVSFNRRFVLGNRRVGRSQLASLDTTVERAAGENQALSSVVTLALVLNGPQGEEFFAEGYARGARFRPEDVDVEVMRAGTLGNAFVALARFRSPLGQVETAIGVVAVGRHVGRISAVAPAGRLVMEDVVALLAAQARRMATQ